MSDFRDAQWDYGLEPGESFEPDSWEAEEFDRALPHVMTALGPIDPGALGFTLLGQRLLTYPPAGLPPVDADLVLDDLAAAASELEGFAVTGGQAVVDLSTPASGRSVDDLLFVAQRSPVHVIVSTGCTAAHAAGMIEEITTSIDASGVCAGAIVLDSNQTDDISAVVETQVATGVPIFVIGDVAATQRLLEAGVAADRIAVVTAGAAEVNALLQSGVRVQINGWGSGDREVELPAARLAHDLIQEYGIERILIGGDLTRRSRRMAHGGFPGFVHMLDDVPLQLMETGLSAIQVRQLMIENVADLLTITIPGSTI